jgi:proteasome lid subunit RPN8/RPN11
LSTPFRIQIPIAIYEEMVTHARAELPFECCGLLAGRIDPAEGIDPDIVLPVRRALKRYPLINAAQSRTEYLSDPRSMFEAVRDMRALGLEILAVYHSHPTSEPVPSRTDRERNFSPEVVNFIISLKPETPEVRGWWLTAEEHHEAAWELIPKTS